MRKKAVDTITRSAGLMVPISFLRELKFMPFFPPTEASTAPSRVVGTFTKRMPRLNVAAAKPPMSVITPPPTLISSDCRVAPPSLSSSHIRLSVSRLLEASPASTFISDALLTASDIFLSVGSTKVAVFVSVSTNTDAGAAWVTNRSIASPTWLVKRRFSEASLFGCVFIAV